jgi:transposase
VRRCRWAATNDLGASRHADYLLRLHRREPDLTLNEICGRLERARGERVSPSMIWRFFDRHDITFKNVWPAPSARGFVELGG